jgi:hypothetical protein
MLSFLVKEGPHSIIAIVTLTVSTNHGWVFTSNELCHGHEDGCYGWGWDGVRKCDMSQGFERPTGS